MLQQTRLQEGLEDAGGEAAPGAVSSSFKLPSSLSSALLGSGTAEGGGGPLSSEEPPGATSLWQERGHCGVAWELLCQQVPSCSSLLNAATTTLLSWA